MAENADNLSIVVRSGGCVAASTTAGLKAQAQQLGFSLCGICPAVSPPGVERLNQWLAAGYAGQMHYLPDRAEASRDPGRVLDGARSIVMLAMNYCTVDPVEPRLGEGRVSRYAWGDDYHEVIRERLNVLADWLRCQTPGANVRGVVDTAPLMEREFAQMAGLGWIGKNTLLLNKQLGSWFFLGALLTDLELEYDAPHEIDHCGTCRACLDACPTDAFVDAYVLDARRCISYLNIELRDAIPTELREGIGDWLFGCDVCQDVCPWNHHAPQTAEPAFQPTDGMNPQELTSLFDLDEAAFRARFRHTPLWRAKRRGLLRNAAIILGNQADEAAVPALVKGLNDEEPLVRGACAWALRNYRCSEAIDALARRLGVENDTAVLHEIYASCDHSTSQLESSEVSNSTCLPGKSSA